MMNRIIIFFFVFLIPLASLHAQRVTPSQIRNQYLLPTARWEEELNRRIAEKISRLNSSKDHPTTPLEVESYLFTFKQGFDDLLRRLEAKGLNFKEPEVKEKSDFERDPHHLSDYRQAIAIKDNKLFILSTHLYEATSREWVPQTNVQVVLPKNPDLKFSAEEALNSPSQNLSEQPLLQRQNLPAQSRH